MILAETFFTSAVPVRSMAWSSSFFNDEHHGHPFATATKGGNDQRPADQYRVGTQGQQLQYIGAATYAAIGKDDRLALNSGGDIRQHLGRAGVKSSTRPPWLETTIAAAPALTASSASSAVITPLTIAVAWWR